jgi:thiamine-monophosphate kinase
VDHPSFQGSRHGAEADLIDRFLRHLGAVRTDVRLGIGDDAALLRPAPGSDLVQTTDALVEHVHFLPGSPARSLGHRALAVNLSDLAAMGASPAWALLSLTLPAVDERWLADFAAGFGTLAREHGVALVGGNLSRGPLTATVLLSGQVAEGTALRRDGGRAGDDVWVSGTLGDSSLGRPRAAPGAPGAAVPPRTQGMAEADAAWLRARHEFPTPRIALGAALRGVASACIDLSDGLLADLPRLAEASGCGAELDVDRLPLSDAAHRLGGAEAWREALAGGEDYELCFTAPPARAAEIEAVAARVAVPVQRCGRLRAGAGLELRRNGTVIEFSQLPFDHFANTPS